MSIIAQKLEGVEFGETGPANQFIVKPMIQAVKELTRPKYVIQGLVIQGYTYTMTAKNNSGKSTLATKMIECVATGGPFCSLKTIQGRVLLLSGENAYDTNLKFKYLQDEKSVDLSFVDVIERSFDLKVQVDRLIEEVQQEYSLVMVDSLQAYFGEGDFNSNSDTLNHIKALRKLTDLKGNPAVIALAHPTKSGEALEPYGGGSAMNELDGNFTLQLERGIATFHHLKLRQPSFSPLNFELSVVEIAGFEDNFGICTTTTQFSPISGEHAATNKARVDEDSKLGESAARALLANQDAKEIRNEIIDILSAWPTLSKALVQAVLPTKEKIIGCVSKNRSLVSDIFESLVGDGEIVRVDKVDATRKKRYKEITNSRYPNSAKGYCWLTLREVDFFD